MKKLILLFCLGMSCFLLSIVSAQESRISDDLDSKIGVIYSDGKNNLKLEIPNEKLKKGTKILIITLPVQSIVCCVEIVGISSSETKTIPKVHFDRGKTLMYDLKVINGYDVQLGFGIIDSTLEFKKKSNKVIGDLDKDGILEYFRDCTSTEGVHLTIWSGELLKGIKLWHAYFYLGYGVEPSCLEENFK